jgi:hypothetical protein
MAEYTVKVHFISGEERIVPAKDIKHVGEEDAQRGTALVDDKEVPIYKRSEPEWGPLWYEQEQRPEPEEEDYEEDEEEIEGDGSGLHQCPYCYNLVNAEHEEFCQLNPNRNENF